MPQRLIWLLIVLALAVHAARIVSVRNDKTRGDSPFFSANDRSRWCTIRALVEYGTFEIDRVIGADQAIHWDTIDKVRHIGHDGQLHFYSSKPPLLPWLIAGPYYVLKAATGWTLADHPLLVARILLLGVNLLFLSSLLIGLAYWLSAQNFGWETRCFVLAAAGFGTMLTTFGNTLNNHLPAAAAVMCSLALLDAIWRQRAQSIAVYVMLGATASFAAANELPALAFWAGCAALVTLCNPIRALVGFLPGTALIAVPFFVTNWMAHAEMGLAYAHRSDGPVLFTLAGDFRDAIDRSQQIPAAMLNEFQTSADAEAFLSMQQPTLDRSGWMGSTESALARWVLRDGVGPQQWAVVQVDSETLEVRKWGNWYDYPGSYWSAAEDRRSAVDRGEASLGHYLFHCLLGHHGFFSLTPLWIPAGLGLLYWAMSRRSLSPILAWMGIGLSVVVVAFYVTREAHDRNYGGMTSGLRWAFWLIPFWLGGLAVAAERCKTTWAWRLLMFCLSASVFSATWAWANPWVHPWLYELWSASWR